MSFRIKLLLAMMLVVGAVTTATLFATQKKVQSAYEQIFAEQFQSQIDYFNQIREARLGVTRDRSLTFVKSIRCIAAMTEYLENKSPESLKTLQDVFFTALVLPGARPGSQQEGYFAYLIDDKGALIPFDRSLDRPRRPEGPPSASSEGRRRGGPPIGRGGGPFRGPGGPGREHFSPRDLESQLSTLSTAIKGKEQQQVGYLAPVIRNTNEVNISTNSHLYEVVLTKIIDPADDRVMGAVVLGFFVADSADTLNKMSRIQSGIFIDGEIHSSLIPDSVQPVIAQKISAATSQRESVPGLEGSKFESQFPLRIEDVPHTIFFRALNLNSAFPSAYQVCVYSLEEPERVQRDLRSTILILSGLAMAAALAVSLVLSHGLSAPVNEIVAGTRQVEQGNFNIRVPVRSSDEIGALAQSFNQMTEGLALKEKYRSVLDKVSDKRIADSLLNGAIALGGEQRQVSVLFCDIRGFTALTQNMEPPEVIQMLNEHFTPLTKIVKEHQGVVDKFVGDLIMAVFGAPTSHGNDPVLAAQCALRMIEERAKLNQNSKYKITVGIGVATGQALAGCMGSEDRLNYTVLGPRVNLASRLCGQAGRMEVVIDEDTYAAFTDKNSVKVEPMPEMKLKGFSDPVHAYKLLKLPGNQ